MSVAVVVGNPRPRSRTFRAATLLAARLAEAPPEPVIDVIELGPGLLAPGDQAVSDAVASVCSAQSVVVASPTYKATFTGVLKLFLDQFATGGLKGVVAFPLMLGGAWQHSLAPEVFLRPLLVELGATCPMRGLYLLDDDFEDPVGLAEWVEEARRFVG